MNLLSATIAVPSSSSAAVAAEDRYCKDSAVELLQVPEARVEAPGDIETHFASPENWRNHPCLTGFCVFYAGRYIEAAEHRWQGATMNEGIYIYCTGGKGIYRSNGKEWQVEAGDMLYCAPFSNHSYVADALEPWSIYWMHVAGSEIGSYSEMLGFAADRPVIRLGFQLHVIDTFKSMFQYLERPQTKASMAALAGAGRLMLASLALDGFRKKKNTMAEAGIQRVLEHMARNVDGNASIADWAKIYGGARSRFNRVFTSVVGWTAYNYFLHLKIQKACKLLEDTDMRIGKIALAVGVSDIQYFSRLFRKLTGQSARDYRKQARLKG